ncbi:hypothetical protein OAJ44_04620 [Chloroflexi bacterium]|nr:hypothetical protein [Chloroflexota bacterium]
MKKLFLKLLIASVAVFSSIMTVGTYIDLTLGVWIGHLGLAITAGLWYWFFHLFYEHRSNKGK